ncbi:MAG: HlyD family efflux transporter periplasmic adaptor subunit [Verrucomicrobiota bacterium]
MKNDRNQLQRQRARAGLSTTATVGGIVGLAAAITLLGLAFMPDFGGPSSSEYITAEVTSAPFIHEVWERGELESSNNVEVRCEVKSQNSSGINIIEIVPEGTIVKKDEFLVKLDDSALQTQLIQQEIICSNSEADVDDAVAALEAARLELLEYENGTFVQEKEQVQSELFVAQENKRRAEEYLGYSEKMAQRGYVSSVQIEADKFAVEKANKEFEVAQTKLNVLEKYTKTKQITLLNAAIKTAEGKVKAKKKTYELDAHRLAEIEDQIEKCTIYAPSAGQVVYANDPNRRSSSGDLLVAEGRPVRERQVIIRLPDANKMMVNAKVHESRINHLQPGMRATVTLDAYTDQVLSGEVVSIGEFPIPSYNMYQQHIKEYAVGVEIETNLPNLRPGMSAEVKVLVNQLEDAIQVPIHAVIERSERFFCAVPNGGEFETREIQVGPLNEDSIVVTEGLEIGESVVLRFPELEAMLDLPETDAEKIEAEPSASE